METIQLENDIPVLFIPASSFPEGITAAHEKLHKLISSFEKRKYFGISRPENGSIIYRAAVEELYEGEAEKFQVEKLILRKGEYISIILKNYHENIQNIEVAFEKLIHYPGIDPEGYCVEWYYNERDMRCMVRLNDE